MAVLQPHCQEWIFFSPARRICVAQRYWRWGAPIRRFQRMAFMAEMCDRQRMVKKERRRPPTSGENIANALDRWDDEGGAPATLWALPYQTGDLLDVERQVLECLGAALVSEWNGLPTEIQRKLFEHPTSGASGDSAQLKSRIARLLHDRRTLPNRNELVRLPAVPIVPQGFLGRFQSGNECWPAPAGDGGSRLDRHTRS